MKYIPHTYQEYTTAHIIDNPAAGVLLEMGLGKTVSTLTAIDLLLNEYMDISKPLVIAPKKVAEGTWTAEAQKWDHLKHLKISIVLGTEKERKQALRAKADIYVTSRDNVAWLIAYYAGAFPFDMVVVDESSSFKNPKSVRFKALRTKRPLVSRLVILTGTPVPNGLIDIWGQVFLLDRGERLGETLEGFRNRYFKKDPYVPHAKYQLIGEAGTDKDQNYYAQKIHAKISDICISMRAKDWLDLPPRIEREVPVYLPADVMEQYGDFEKKQVMALPDEAEITAINAAALTTKLLQFAGGAIYDEEKTVHQLHTAKLDVLEELIEAANGHPVLIGYWFKHEKDRIMARLKKYGIVEYKSYADLVKWNRGEITVMLGHPASMSHGLNLQDGGHNIIWFSQIWNLELYLQFNARLDRQGQKFPVLIQHLIAEGTIEVDVRDARNGKEDMQDAMMEAVKARITKYKN